MTFGFGCEYRCVKCMIYFCAAYFNVYQNFQYFLLTGAILFLFWNSFLFYFKGLFVHDAGYQLPTPQLPGFLQKMLSMEL
jgi:hypothetical protein